jgi:hypothetical protein
VAYELSDLNSLDKFIDIYGLDSLRDDRNEYVDSQNKCTAGYREIASDIAAGRNYGIQGNAWIHNGYCNFKKREKPVMQGKIHSTRGYKVFDNYDFSTYTTLGLGGLGVMSLDEPYCGSVDRYRAAGYYWNGDNLYYWDYMMVWAAITAHKKYYIPLCNSVDKILDDVSIIKKTYSFAKFVLLSPKKNE